MRSQNVKTAIFCRIIMDNKNMPLQLVRSACQPNIHLLLLHWLSYYGSEAS